MKLFYLGPQNTFSHQAARMFAASHALELELEPRVSLESVVRSLHTAPQNALAIVPYYNYLEGLVQETLDIIYEQQVSIVDSQRVPIVLCLGGFGPTVPTIYSHPKALAQCSRFLQSCYAELALCPLASTSEAVTHVKEQHDGWAIASRMAFDVAGVPVIADDIGNKQFGKSNFTDFFVVSNQQQMPLADELDLTLVAITPYVERVGLLQDILMQIAFYGINLAKIHSRPAIDRVAGLNIEPQMFYLEMECSKSSGRFERCVEALQYKFTVPGGPQSVRVLGSYPFPG